MPLLEQESPNARERILSAAENLFLSCGSDAVSIRELTDTAGVNVALVNYYFGSKRNLYLEVLKRYFATIAEKKCAELQSQFSNLQDLSLRNILHAYIELYLGDPANMEAVRKTDEMISRQLAEDEDATELILHELIIPIHQTLKSAIRPIIPDLSTDKLSLCIGSVTGQIFHFLRFPKAFEALVDLPEGTNLREAVTNHIIEFSLRGFSEESPCA